MSYKGKVNIHIGMHKTATSTLQRLFTQTYEKNGKDFLYPLSGRMEEWFFAHHKLISDFNKNEFKWHFRLLDEINDYAKRNNGNIVISCEDYSFTHNFGALLYLINLLEDYYIEIFLAFRDYVGWFESFYLEQAKRKTTQLEPMNYVFENFHNHKYSHKILFLKGLGLNFRLLNFQEDDFVKKAFKDIVGFELSDEITVYHWNQDYSYPMTKVLMDIYKETPDLDVLKTLDKAYQMERFLGINRKDYSVFKEKECKNILGLLQEEREILNLLIPEMADDLFSYEKENYLNPLETLGEKEIMHYLFKSFLEQS